MHPAHLDDLIRTMIPNWLRVINRPEDANRLGALPPLSRRGTQLFRYELIRLEVVLEESLKKPHPLEHCTRPCLECVRDALTELYKFVDASA